MTTAGAFLRQTEVIVIAVVVCLAGFAFFMSRESTASRDMLPSSTNIATGDTDTTKYGGQSTASAANTTPSPARLGDSNGPSNPGAPEKRVQSSDPAAIARIIQNRVVWIGLKFRIGEKDQTFPVASGWCLSNREIITTGTAIVELEKGEKEGTVVVYSGLLPASNRFVEVSRLRRHPVFEREPFGTSLSTENNLGLIELSNPISFSAEQRDAVASFPEWTEWYKSRDARGMMRCGYQIHSPGEPLSAVNVPEFSWSKMTVTQANPGSDGLEQLPVIRVALDKAAPSFSGHVVVDFSGKLLGTLERVDNQNGFLIPSDRLSDF